MSHKPHADRHNGEFDSRVAVIVSVISGILVSVVASAVVDLSMAGDSVMAAGKVGAVAVSAGLCMLLVILLDRRGDR